MSAALVSAMQAAQILDLRGDVPGLLLARTAYMHGVRYGSALSSVARRA